MIGQSCFCLGNRLRSLRIPDLNYATIIEKKVTEIKYKKKIPSSQIPSCGMFVICNFNILN